MSKVWMLRESYEDKRREDEAKEAYECGFNEGYEAAMEDSQKESDGAGSRYRLGMRRGERDMSEGDEEMGYRKGRSSMRRYR